MKITLVTREFFPLTGGLQALAAQLGQELQKKGCDFEIITRFTNERKALERHLTDSEKDQITERKSIRTHIIGHSHFSSLFLRRTYPLLFRKTAYHLPVSIFSHTYQEKIARVITDADVVHFLGQGLELLGFAALSAARKLGKPFIVEPCVHPGQWGDHFVDLRLYRQADALIAHTRFEKQFLESHGIASQKIQVLHGFEDRTDGDGSRFRKKYNITGKLVLFLGRRSQDKGYPVAIKAFLDALKDHPDARLVVIGPPDDYQIKVPSPYQNYVIELGLVEECEKHDALAACDVLCVPSAGESFGMVYMEAWRYKKPVIARKIPVLEELNGNHPGGILVENHPEDKKVAEHVSSALSILLGDRQLCQKLGERGFHIASRFTWENVIERYIGLYQHTLETSKNQ